MDIFFKDPDERLDFHFEWQASLPDGDYVTASSWIVAPGVTATDASFFVGYEDDLAGRSREVQRCSVFLTGGTVGQTYAVTNRVTTARGRQMDRSFELRIQEH